MSVQTTYLASMAVAIPGLLVGDAHITESGIVQTAAVTMGNPVKLGTSGDQVVTGGGQTMRGIAVRKLIEADATGSEAMTFAVGDVLEVYKGGGGGVWATCADACVKGDLANVVDATGAFGSGAAASGESQLDGEWMTSAQAGGLAVLYLNSNKVAPYFSATATQTAKTFTQNAAITAFTPLAGVGGKTPLRYFVSSGVLPAGLALSATTGAVSGTPTATQTATSLTFGVTDAIGRSSGVTSTVAITISA
jgi:hypothetical protein